MSSMVTKRRSRIGGNESASHVVLSDGTADILSLIEECFGLVPKCWILRHVQCLGFIVGSDIRTALWLRCSIRLCSSRASVASKKTLRKKTMGEYG